MKKLLILAVSAVVLSSCGTSQGTNADYDKGVDFSQIKTYNYYEDNKIGLNEIEKGNFMLALDQEMLRRGFVKSENPDVNISIDVKEGAYRRNNSINLGVGTSIGGWLGLGTSVPVSVGTTKYKVYTAGIQMVDVKENKSIWIAETSKQMSASSDNKDRAFESIAKDLFKKYPFKQNKKAPKTKLRGTENSAIYGE